MYKNEEVKKAYFAERYRTHKEQYKANQALYWENKAKQALGKDSVTEEEIRQVYNDYHKQYRKRKPEVVKKNTDDFWERKAENNEDIM